MQKQLKDFTEVELKALKSDIYEEQARLSQNLQIINNELQSRTQKAQEKPKMEEEKIVEAEVESEVTGTEPVETGDVTASEEVEA